MTEYSMEELLPIVVELSEKYTSKESSSISYDKAKQLMHAVIYCINELNDRVMEEGELQSIIKSQRSAKEDYKEGYSLVIKKVMKVKEKYDRIIEDFQPYGNLCLKETVLKGIPGFLRYYDAKFAPQDHILTFDYPTLVDPLTKSGVDAVYSYVSSIETEQEFLRAFPKELIQTILESYQNDYETLFINISSVVIRSVIGAMIAKKPLEQSAFSSKDYDVIRLWIRQKEENLEDSLIEILHLFIQKGYHGNQQILSYLQRDISDFSMELSNAYKHDCLDRIIC